MQGLISTNRDIYFNLALEEFLLMHDVRDYFVLWQSEPAVVVGKHQNTLAEINYRFVREKGIRIARRLSGGGTVYHDEGNLNFTYIANGEPGKLVDFKRFIEPVTAFLGSLGLDAEQGMKNEILAHGKKISGNAEHVYKNRVLHHGTLLYKSDLNILRESLRVIQGRYRDKAVQSNRSSVINISDCLNNGMELGSFETEFLSFMLARFAGKKMEMTEVDQSAVSEMAETKYSSWDWIFGWSPDYELNSNFQFQEQECRIYVRVHRGKVKDCILESNVIQAGELDRLKTLLQDCRHDPDSIRKAINGWNYPAIRQEKIIEEMVWSFF